MFIWINVFFYTGVVYYLRSKRSWCWRSCYVDLDHLILVIAILFNIDPFSICIDYLSMHHV